MSKGNIGHPVEGQSSCFTFEWHQSSQHAGKCRSKFSWGLLLSKVQDGNGVIKDVIKNYVPMTTENILVFSNTYLSNGNQEDPPDDRILPDLQPCTNDDHTRMFYNPVRSQIVAQGIFGIFDRASINKLMTMKKQLI